MNMWLFGEQGQSFKINFIQWHQWKNYQW